MKRLLLSVALSALLAVPALAQDAPPARFHAQPDISTDEGGLWGMSDRAEREAQASAELINDAELNAYVRGVACRVAGPACPDIRLYVMNRPYFNASMAPNGYMEVWSGLLLRVDDEAQLAFVLGHEIGHYTERHSLQQLHTLHNRATGAMIFSIVAAGAGAGIIGNIVYLGTLASVFGYSREKETEADAIGFRNAVAAGYDPHAGTALWNNLIAETRASDVEDVRRREAHGSIFASHPLSADRVEALTALAQAQSGGDTFRDRYRAAIRPHLDEWLRQEVRRRDFGETLNLLEHLGAHHEDEGVIEFYRGEVYRLRRQDGDLARAKERYIAALTYADVPARAWRELGEIRARDGDQAEAANCFRFYLEKAPAAEDRALVEARIASLAGGATQ